METALHDAVRRHFSILKKVQRWSYLLIYNAIMYTSSHPRNYTGYFTFYNSRNVRRKAKPRWTRYCLKWKMSSLTMVPLKPGSHQENNGWLIIIIIKNDVILVFKDSSKTKTEYSQIMWIVLCLSGCPIHVQFMQLMWQ